MVATSYPERLKIGELSQEGLTDRQIAAKLGFSIPTIRKWRRKLKQGGKAAVLSTTGQPQCGPLGSFPIEMVKQFKWWCIQHPGWGAKTLRIELSLCEAFQNQSLPNRATLARWLKQQGEVRLYEKHTHYPAQDSYI